MTQKRSRSSFFGVLLQLLPPVLVCALFAAVGLVHVCSRVLVVRTGYTLSQAQNENRALVRENDRLRLELATLKNPMRLEKVAREDLRMAPPPPGAVTTLVSTPRLGRTVTRESTRPEGAAAVARAERPKR